LTLTPIATFKNKCISVYLNFKLLIFQGLELKYEHNKQLYLTFKNTELRDYLYNNLLNHPKIDVEKHESYLMTLKWQNGALSNYDYLCYLNRCLKIHLSFEISICFHLKNDNCY